MKCTDSTVKSGYCFEGKIQFQNHQVVIYKDYENKEDAVSFRDCLSQKIKESIANKVEFIVIDNNIINLKQIEYIQFSITFDEYPAEFKFDTLSKTSVSVG